jgi:protein TonB
MHLTWVGLALLLHGALLAAMPQGKIEPVQIPAPVQISLLDPAPVQAAPAAPPAPPKSPPVKASVKPKPVAKPIPAPTPRPVPAPQPEPTPAAPPSDEPTAAPAQPETESSASSSASTSHTAPAQNTGSGDTLIEASFDAAYLRNPKPVYPPMSRRLREEGKVMLRVNVLPDGLPSVIEIKRSSGSARLDEAAKAAVSRWRFVPARRSNEAVASWVLVPLVFSLES